MVELSEIPKLPVLVSYAYMRDVKDPQLESWFGRDDIEWLIDSGGFSALNAGHEISLDDYCDWLARYQQHFHGYVALDKVGDVKQTDVNLRLMHERGLKPMPVHVWGDDEARMDQLFEWSDWVALGGLRRPHSTHAPRSYIKAKHEWAKGRRVHWLGYTHGPMVRAFKPYSVDSSNVLAGFRWGLSMFYLGDGKTWTKPFRFGENNARTPNIDRLTVREEQILNRLGFSASQFRDRRHHAGGSQAGFGARAIDKPKNIAGLVTMNSFIRYALDMRRLYGVRVFIAVTNANLGRLLSEYDAEVARLLAEPS
jgi:hypothetical protein